mgnify:CR=1 FL=1
MRRESDSVRDALNNQDDRNPSVKDVEYFISPASQVHEWI